MQLCQALEVKRGEVIALIGAGGKTAALYLLARELSPRGRVIVTTTTRIRPPHPDQVPCLILASDQARLLTSLEKALEGTPIVAAAAALSSEDKLVGLEPEAVDLLRERKLADYILVEADGAAGRSFKAPAPYEPVIPSSTTLVVAFVGIDVVGKPFSPEWVHRPERVARLFPISPGEEVTLEAIATVMLHPEGNARGCPPGARSIPLINKVDTPRDREVALNLARLLLAGGAKVVVLACLARGEVVEVVR